VEDYAASPVFYIYRLFINRYETEACLI